MAMTRPRWMSLCRMRPTVETDAHALAMEQDGDLALAPHGIGVAQRLDGVGERGGPLRGTSPVRLTGDRFDPLIPAIEGRAADADGAGGLLGGEALRAGRVPASQGVSTDGDAAWGDRRQARRQGGAAIHCGLKAKNLPWGSPELVGVATPASEIPKLFQEPSRLTSVWTRTAPALAGLSHLAEHGTSELVGPSARCRLRRMEMSGLAERGILRASFRRVARFSGAWSRRLRERSSSKSTSSIQWRLFSIRQCARMAVAKRTASSRAEER
jgi:hypothetical protein